MYLLCGVCGAFVGVVIGMFLCAAGAGNKEADAYTKGYMDGLKAKKGLKR